MEVRVLSGRKGGVFLRGGVLSSWCWLVVGAEGLRSGEYLLVLLDPRAVGLGGVGGFVGGGGGVGGFVVGGGEGTGVVIDICVFWGAECNNHTW